MTTNLNIDHPWPGPDSFRTQDAPFFHGREQEIRQLLQLIQRARSVVLYGASGLGKTSLINAGVVPRLPAGEYFAVPIRISYVKDAPPVSEQLQAAILEVRSESGMPERRPGRTAWEFLHLRDEPIEGPQPLLIFDQFEELFTIGAATPQAGELLEELKGLIEGVPPASVRERLEKAPEEARSLSFQRNNHRVLISIREDFLYGLESLRAQLPSIIHDRYRIGPLSGTNALEVVRQRTADTDLPEDHAALVEIGVASLIVRTVAAAVHDQRPLGELEVEPALLSVLCSELARRREAGTPITRELVTGNRTEIITSFYQRALSDVPAGVREYLEDQLVTPSGFRTSVVLQEALAVPGFTNGILSSLVDRRLLRVIDRSNGKWLELTHDILTEIAAQSRKLRREREREQKEREARVERERAELRARELRDRLRRRRVFLAGAALWAALFMLGFFLYREKGMRQAADDAKAALRRQYIDASLREGRYREALVQLAAAVKEEPGASWARALAGDLLVRRGWPRPVRPLFPEGPFTFLDCNDTGTRCAAAYRDGRVLVRGDISQDLSIGQKGYSAMSMSGDGSRLTVVPEQPGEALNWSFASSGTVFFRIPLRGTWNSWSMSNDGQVIVLPRDLDLQVWRLNPSGSAFEPTEIRRALGNAPFSLSLDGRWLAYANDRETVKVVDLTASGGDKSGRLFPTPGLVRDVLVDSKILLVSMPGGTLQRWALPSGERLGPIQTGREITWIRSNKAMSLIALDLEGGGIQLWNSSWRDPVTLLRSSAGVMNLRFSQDSQWLAAATRDGLVSFWDVSGASLGEPVRHEGVSFAFPVRRASLVTLSVGGDSARWTVIPPLRLPGNFTLGEAVRSAWFISEDAFFAHGQKRSLERSGGREQTQSLMRNNLYFSRDRRFIATIFAGSLLLREGLPKRNPDDADKKLASVTMDNVGFSADGSRLAAAGGGKGYLFEVASAERIGEPIEDVTGAWLDRQGTTVATKKADLGLTLWHCESGGTLRKLADVDAPVVRHVAFNGTGDAVVVVAENQARVWSLRERRFIGLPISHRARILDAQFSPDGRWIATGSEDERARIWEAATGLPASDWFEHAGSVTVATFSPSGRKLLTASTSGEVRIWELPGSWDAPDPERLWLARLAEILSGIRIDPETSEVLPARRADEALARLREEVARECPGAAAPPHCDSAANKLIREVLGDSSDSAAQTSLDPAGAAMARP